MPWSCRENRGDCTTFGQMKSLWISCSLFILCAGLNYGQDLELDSSGYAVIMPHIHYGAGLPGADLKDRFGLHFDLGAGVSILSKRNLFFGAGLNFIFGNDVKENVLSSLLTAEGGIIGSDMRFASVFLRERGFQVHLDAGYLFAAKNLQKKSGLLLTAGVGVLSHHIRFVDDFDSVIQLQSPYHRGYDRWSMGISINEFIGYVHLSDNRMVNFYGGIQLTQGLTTNVRGYNYDQMLEDTARRFDVLTTLQVGWIFPISLRRERRFY